VEGEVIREIEISGEGSAVLSDPARHTYSLMATSIPPSYTLDQNYPNPFNPSTSIRYTLPVSGHVSLRIYNSIGQEVARLVDQQEDAGIHIVRWHAGDISTGVYFYKLSSGPYSDRKKMVYIK
jgi:hypothetical protein